MRLLLLPTLVCLGLARLAAAEGPQPHDLRRDTNPVAAAVSPTPEMWFYEQERSRYDDPKSAVRRKAEFRSAQRSSRMASMKWFGMSNSRPAASITPFFDSYSPAWTASGADPYRWRAGGAPLATRPTATAY